MVVPKLIAHRVLEPALGLDRPVELVCIEDKPDFQTVRRSVGTAPNEISAVHVVDTRRAKHEPIAPEVEIWRS